MCIASVRARIIMRVEQFAHQQDAHSVSENRGPHGLYQCVVVLMYCVAPVRRGILRPMLYWAGASVSPHQLLAMRICGRTRTRGVAAATDEEFGRHEFDMWGTRPRGREDVRPVEQLCAVYLGGEDKPDMH